MNKTAKWIIGILFASFLIGLVLGWRDGFPPGPRTSALVSLVIGFVVGGSIYLLIRLSKFILHVIGSSKTK